MIFWILYISFLISSFIIILIFVEHVLTHNTLDKTYSCRVCRACFSRPGMLRKHMETHYAQLLRSSDSSNNAPRNVFTTNDQRRAAAGYSRISSASNNNNNISNNNNNNSDNSNNNTINTNTNSSSSLASIGAGSMGLLAMMGREPSSPHTFRSNLDQRAQFENETFNSVADALEMEDTKRSSLHEDPLTAPLLINDGTSPFIGGEQGGLRESASMELITSPPSSSNVTPPLERENGRGSRTVGGDYESGGNDGSCVNEVVGSTDKVAFEERDADSSGHSTDTDEDVGSEAGYSDHGHIKGKNIPRVGREGASDAAAAAPPLSKARFSDGALSDPRPPGLLGTSQDPPLSPVVNSSFKHISVVPSSNVPMPSSLVKSNSASAISHSSGIQPMQTLASDSPPVISALLTTSAVSATDDESSLNIEDVVR